MPLTPIAGIVRSFPDRRGTHPAAPAETNRERWSWRLAQKPGKDNVLQRIEQLSARRALPARRSSPSTPGRARHRPVHELISTPSSTGNATLTYPFAGSLTKSR
jgi:hypothetical protein